jgi:hypothetical protein
MMLRKSSSPAGVCDRHQGSQLAVRPHTSGGQWRVTKKTAAAAPHGDREPRAAIRGDARSIPLTQVLNPRQSH